MIKRPKQSELPEIRDEGHRDSIISGLKPNHLYSYNEVAYLYNMCRKTIERYVLIGVFQSTYRGTHPYICGAQIKSYYFQKN